MYSICSSLLSVDSQLSKATVPWLESYLLPYAVCVCSVAYYVCELHVNRIDLFINLMNPVFVCVCAQYVPFSGLGVRIWNECSVNRRQKTVNTSQIIKHNLKGPCVRMCATYPIKFTKYSGIAKNVCIPCDCRLVLSTLPTDWHWAFSTQVKWTWKKTCPVSIIWY